MSGPDRGPRLALVTGGARGIGRAISLKLARDGANVVVADLEADGEKGPTIQEIRALGRKCLYVACNVADAEQVDAMAARVSAEMGTVQILVNNAGITKDNLLIRMQPAEWDAVLSVNLRGTFLCTKAFARGMMKERWGRIVSIASVVGLTGNRGQANYAASKAGIVGFTKSVAKELAERGITVNAVAPGYIETPMTAGLPEEVKAAFLEKIPLKSLGSPEDVAHAVAFLASEEARYMTGQVLSVDGGMSMS
jgi:3-oxoacyl-[acyl-carrier protein] reductase